MKFFGWGRKKDPPPIAVAHKKFKYSDAARSTQSPGGAEYGSDQLVGLEDQPQKTPPRRVGAQPRPSKDWLGEPRRADLGSETWEERLQETIRFVFSHEQEGLLAIGTFALDQLAEVTHLDSRQKPPAATGPHNVNSRRNSVSSVQVVIREVQSSDDETESQHSMRSPIPAQCKRKEQYPVFGDHDASSWAGVPLCRSASVGSTKTAASAKDHQPPCTNSPNANTTHEAGNLTLPTATRNHVPPSTTLFHDESSSQDSCLPGVFGLFAARSRRTQKHGRKPEIQRKKPLEKQTANCSEQRKPGANSKPSRSAQAGRLWRSGCTGSSVSAKVSPEKKLNSCPPPHHTQPQAQGPPCIANIVEESGPAAQGGPNPESRASEAGEQRKRRGHSFGKGWGCAHNGKWIRTDSEYGSGVTARHETGRTSSLFTTTGTVTNG